MPGMTPMVQRIMIACGVIWLLQLVLGRSGVPLTELGAVSVSGVFSHGFSGSRSPTCGCTRPTRPGTWC